jgi:hypothetical protein
MYATTEQRLCFCGRLFNVQARSIHDFSFFLLRWIPIPAEGDLDVKVGSGRAETLSHFID